MSNLIENGLIQLLIIVFNIITIPFLFRLISGTYHRLKNNKKPDKMTAFLLIILFDVLMVTAIISIFVSTHALIVSNGITSGKIHTGDISLVRSFLFSLSNLFVSLYFYKIYCLGNKPKFKKK